MTPASIRAILYRYTQSNDDDLFAPADGRTLVNTSYPGAVAPGTPLEQAWFYGWTVWTEDGSDSRANQAGN